MENTPAFDLDHAISEWRSALASSVRLSHEEVRELEIHLRESCDSLAKGGLNPEEAFWVAKKRLGHAVELEMEFGKVDPARVWRDRLTWLVAGVAANFACMTGYSFLESILSQCLARLGVQAAGPSWWWAQVVMFQVITAALFAIAVRFAKKQERVRAVQRRFFARYGFVLALFLIAGSCVVVAWVDGRLVLSRNGDLLGGMLAAGSAIERTAASMLNAGLLVVLALALVLVFRRWNAEEKASKHRQSA